MDDQQKILQPKRGELYLADLGPQPGNRMRGQRPVIIISNDISNRFAPIVQVIPVSSKVKKLLPVHVFLEAAETGLLTDSIALCEQSTVLNKTPDLIRQLSKLKPEIMAQLEKAILIHYGIGF